MQITPTSPATALPENSVYRINSRCEEILPRRHYILSVGPKLFYLNNYHTDTLYRPGDSLHFLARIIPFREQANPGEFSYARYLKQKKVYSQLIPLTAVIQKDHSDNIGSFFYRLREKLMDKTAALTQDTTCRQLINALCLGDKTELDNDFRELFITTGTVHVLSVSGLHTGVIYLFLLFLLRHLGCTHRKSEILLLPLLWAYACLTGLSPSVVRASTILSFITAGKVFCRTYTPLNSLAASAFFTLLFQPSSLYSVSFLLSYSAYAGILIFYPFLLRLPGALPPVVSKIYACCCITFAAQILTLPLSAFYFHTVNLNSFLVNLVAVPLATLLLYCSATCLILPLFVSRYVILICEVLGGLLVRLLQFFSPYSVNVHHIYPSAFCTLFIYGMLIAAGGYLLSRKRRWLYAGITACSFLLAYLIVTNIQLSAKNEVLILHYPKQSVILLNYKGFCLYLQNTLPPQSPPIPYVRQHKLKTLPPETGLSDKQLFCQPHLLVHAKDTIAILSRKHPVYHPCRTLIVTGNLSPGKVFPVTGNTRLPQQIILDGSNNRHTLSDWKTFCLQHRIFLQNTAENGFVRLLLK